MRRLIGVLALLLVVVGYTATAGAAEVQGRIIDFAIEPLPGPVTAGDTVTWQNTGNRPHTITDRGGMFDTGAILPGATAAVTFTVQGTYEIFCEINPSKMNATVVVQPGAATPTEVRIQALDEARTDQTKRFDPAELSVAAGTRVILANVGGLPHSIEAEDGSFSIDVVQPGAEQGKFHGGFGAVVLEEPGAYPFFCTIHPAAMRGTITVTDTQVAAEDRAPPEEVQGAEPTAAVTMADFAFASATTRVAPGGEVTWSNEGTKPHTATFDDVEGLDTGRVEPGASATLTAPEAPGSYSYTCTIHPAQMRGVLVVPPPVREDDGGDDEEAAAEPEGDAPTDGTAVAYAIGAVLLATGAAGLYLALRKRSPAPPAS
jgi:plastocyanin